jgi:hypothetical protein
MSTDHQLIATYKGRPCHELTRDELIEAYTWAVRAIADERHEHKLYIDSIAKLFAMGTGIYGGTPLCGKSSSEKP